MLGDEEKAVLKTAKENYGLTSAEQKILVNLIKKQSKEIEELKKELDLDNECEIALNNRIMDLEKEIEELKEKDDANLAYYDQIYQNGIYTGQKAVEDKIKAKIEEIDNIFKNNRLIDKLKNYFEAQKEVLQSLLEKE